MDTQYEHSKEQGTFSFSDLPTFLPEFTDIFGKAPQVNIL